MHKITIYIHIFILLCTYILYLYCKEIRKTIMEEGFFFNNILLIFSKLFMFYVINVLVLIAPGRMNELGILIRAANHAKIPQMLFAH